MVEKIMKQKQKAKKNIKKRFFEVLAPLTSTSIQLYAASEEELNGRTVKLDLSRNLRGKSIEMILRIKLEDGKLMGIPESAALAPSYIRRVMRSGVDYCEDSFETECRDSIVRIKPFMITRKRVSRSILKGLREEAKDFVIAYVKTRNSKEIITEIITNKLQKLLSLKLKKTYPLALCEIRVFEVLKTLKENSSDAVA
jgi:ribosomal protein S3AE